jgi:serine/threonine protein kinase
MEAKKVLDGRYELLERVARGGEAEVYRARDVVVGREVAVRMPLAGPAAVVTETTGLVPEEHPGWVRHLHSGYDPARGFYRVFELLRGTTLRQRVERAVLDRDEWLIFARESLEAVAALHEAGWTHGDLNADNFHEEGRGGGWKLLELPFLRFSAGEKPVLFGNIHTLSPEQLEGLAPGKPADIYALGCLYYYAAAGVYPHGDGPGAEVAIARLRFAPEPLELRAPELPVAWTGWAMRLLAREPGRRPGAAEAARQLLAIA